MSKRVWLPLGRALLVKAYSFERKTDLAEHSEIYIFLRLLVIYEKLFLIGKIL